MKVRMLDSARIVEVSTNVAFGLVDSGRATYLTGAIKYPDRQMRAEPEPIYKKPKRKYTRKPKKRQKVVQRYKTR